MGIVQAVSYRKGERKREVSTGRKKEEGNSYKVMKKNDKSLKANNNRFCGMWYEEIQSEQ